MWRLALAALLAIVFGLVLGYIPGLNEHLHWNLWYVVPISGLLFGVAAGGIQFAVSFKTNQIVGKAIIFYLAFAAMTGYLAVDYGIYKSTEIEVHGVENIPDGTYALSDLISFWEYTKYNLGSSSVKTRYGTDSLEFGAVGTTISYVADMLGAFLAAAGTLIVLRDNYPFCLSCQRYKRRERKYDLCFNNEQILAEELLKEIHEQMKGGSYLQIVSHLQNLAGKYLDKKGNFRISIDQRCCPLCYEATFLGSVHRRDKNEWNEISELKFKYDTPPESTEDKPADYSLLSESR